MKCTVSSIIHVINSIFLLIPKAEFDEDVFYLHLVAASPRAATAPHLSAAVEDLLGSIDSGRTPDSVLRQLYRLKTFVQQTDSEQLEKALTELSSSSCMSAGQSTPQSPPREACVQPHTGSSCWDRHGAFDWPVRAG